MKAITAEWVAKAEGDLAVALLAFRSRKTPNYDAVCFHAQQCAEKWRARHSLGPMTWSPYERPPWSSLTTEATTFFKHPSFSVPRSDTIKAALAVNNFPGRA